jgi:hypothetical protein
VNLASSEVARLHQVAFLAQHPVVKAKKDNNIGETLDKSEKDFTIIRRRRQQGKG